MNTMAIDSAGIEPHRKENNAITPEDSHIEKALDEALKETFPASDPVSIAIDKSPCAKNGNPHDER